MCRLRDVISGALAIGLTGCVEASTTRIRGEDSAATTGTAPAALGSMTDFNCEPLAEGPFTVPTPWLPLSDEWLAYVDWFDASPYSPEAPMYRGIHDLVAHDGLLHGGVGDIGANPGSLYCPESGGGCDHADADGHGIPVFTRDSDGAAAWPLAVQEEVVYRIRRSGGGLLIAGNDPTEGDGAPKCAAEDAAVPCPDEADRPHPIFELGHVYREVGGDWRASEPIPVAWHILDAAWHDGALYAAGSGIERPDENKSDCTVWRSDDGGVTWDVDFADRDHEPAHERCWFFVAAGERLYTFGARQDSAEVPRNASHVLEDGTWRAAPTFLDGFDASADSEPFDGDRSVVWGRWSDGTATRWRAVEVTDEGERPIPFFESGDWWPADFHLLCSGDLLVLASAQPTDPSLWAVFRTRDLVHFEQLVRWSTPVRVAAVAAWDGKLALGDFQGQLWLSDHVAAP